MSKLVAFITALAGLLMAVVALLKAWPVQAVQSNQRALATVSVDNVRSDSVEFADLRERMLALESKAGIRHYRQQPAEVARPDSAAVRRVAKMARSRME